MTASLAAVLLHGSFDVWQDQIKEALHQTGYTVYRPKHALRCWRDEWVQTHKGYVRYAAGFEVRRLWIGSRRVAIGVSPRTIYLDDDGTPDPRREGEILSDMPRPATVIAAALRRQRDLLDNLLIADCISGQLTLTDADGAIGNAVRIHSGSAKMPANGNLRAFLRKYSFHRPAKDLKLAIIPSNKTCRMAADSFRQRIVQWASEHGFEVQSTVSDMESLDARMTELERGSALRNHNAVAVFILPDVDNAVPPDTLKQMHRMDRLDLRWRRARTSDDQTWSVEDQLGSLVMAGGGVPYFVTVDQDPLPWAIGIDISHPSGSAFSTACVALTDPGGNLVDAWTFRHQRNEQIPEQGIRTLIDAASKKILESDGDPNTLVIRDGRVFEHENARHYTEHCGGRVTLLEVRKGGNPLMLLGSQSTLPNEPMAAMVPNGRAGQYVAFMVTNPAVSFGFPQVLKIHWEKRWNAIGMDAARITRTLCALSFAPGLGLHRHTLPSPIYWADGIAGASDTDLRFRGQRVTRLD